MLGGSRGSALLPAMAARPAICGADFRRGANGGGTSGVDCTSSHLPGGSDSSEPGRDGGVGSGPRPDRDGGFAGGGSGGEGRVAIDGDSGSASAPADGGSAVVVPPVVSSLLVVRVRRATGTDERGAGVGVAAGSVCAAPAWSCCCWWWW